MNVRKEDYSLIQKHKSTYIRHLSLSSNVITQSIISHLSKLTIPLEKLVVDIVTNTGWKNGNIHRLENDVGCPLQWSICFLHINEIQFRLIFLHIDGQIAGAFNRLIGQPLSTKNSLWSIMNP
ncbi:uncharacterized protein CEXT_251721 [Caerostris extrusa]|uniref:Uncharacterized protein n=1 Tax=Caerostris extrusa TaxID=172846 RepID=A0AAV4QZS0_CAEEX|nr:uncharacterized protein CEXT_251721 [Caerostris extrusa]